MIPSAEPSPLIRSYHVLMAMVFAVALGAGWMMLPGDNELIAMLERDGHARAALGILEQGYANGDRRYRTLHQMLALYEEQGDTRKARTILEEMVNARPYDPALRERLVNFYQAVGDQRARVVALKAQIETRYKEAACRQYVALLRLKGDSAEEIAGLQFCRQRGYRRSDDLARLAELLAASGDSVQASTILRAIDDVKRLTSSDDRFLFMDLLLQQGQPNEAVRRSVRWIKATKDQRLAVAVVDILARSNYPDSALDVAKMVYAGTLNVNLLAALRAHEVQGVGLSGVDADLIAARRRPPVTVVDDAGVSREVDYGHVGDVDRVDPRVLLTLLDARFVPVVASLAGDGEGQVFNVNADTVAEALAVALKAQKLLFLTGAPGVLRDRADASSLVTFADPDDLAALMSSGAIAGGMRPKVEACIRAATGGVERTHIIDGRLPDSILLEVFTGAGCGTMIVGRKEKATYLGVDLAT